MPAKAARAVVESPSYRISLRIRHPSIDPQQITTELGLSPDHAWACGEPRRSQAGAGRAGTRRNSYWSATLPSIRQTLSSQLGPSILQTLASKLAAFDSDAPQAVAALHDMAPDVAAHLTVQLWQLRRSQAFLARLLSEGGELSFVVEMNAAEAGTLKLPPALTRSLGTLGATVEFEFI